MSEDFECEVGETVLVRVRDDDGNLRAKLVATVDGFTESVGPGLDMVQLDPPWDQIASIKLRPNEAEFEVVDDGVQF